MTFALNITTAAEKAATARAALLDQLADIRWRAQVGGITLSDGTVVDTSGHSQGMLTSTVTGLDKGMIAAPLDFKFASGWQEVTKAEIEAAAAAVAQHVQACFDAELVVDGQIAALTDAEVAVFDTQAAFDAALSA